MYLYRSPLVITPDPLFPSTPLLASPGIVQSSCVADIYVELPPFVDIATGMFSIVVHLDPIGADGSYLQKVFVLFPLDA